MVLSNRDKSQHSAARGIDGKEIQSEQWQDHADNRFEDVTLSKTMTLESSPQCSRAVRIDPFGGPEVFSP